MGKKSCLLSFRLKDMSLHPGGPQNSNCGIKLIQIFKLTEDDENVDFEQF